MKYRFALQVLGEFFTVIKPQELFRLAVYKKLFGDFIFCPIPLHPKRLAQRGFNQAEINSRKLSILYSIETANNILKKSRSTQAQATLKEKLLRSQNIRGSFIVTGNVMNKNIILIDDVVTTGSTVREAARVLKKGGAAKIFVFALAKG